MLLWGAAVLGGVGGGRRVRPTGGSGVAPPHRAPGVGRAVRPADVGGRGGPRVRSSGWRRPGWRQPWNRGRGRFGRPCSRPTRCRHRCRSARWVDGPRSDSFQTSGWCGIGVGDGRSGASLLGQAGGWAVVVGRAPAAGRGSARGRWRGWRCRATCGRSGCRRLGSAGAGPCGWPCRGWGGGPARCRSHRSRPRTVAEPSPTLCRGGRRCGRSSPPTPTSGIAAGEPLDGGHIGPGVVVGVDGSVEAAGGAVGA